MGRRAGSSLGIKEVKLQFKALWCTKAHQEQDRQDQHTNVVRQKDASRSNSPSAESLNTISDITLHHSASQPFFDTVRLLAEKTPTMVAGTVPHPHKDAGVCPSSSLRSRRCRSGAPHWFKSNADDRSPKGKRVGSRGQQIQPRVGTEVQTVGPARMLCGHDEWGTGTLHRREPQVQYLHAEWLEPSDVIILILLYLSLRTAKQGSS